MAAASRKTSKKRKRKLAKSGRVRKAQARSKGTTRSAADLFGDR
jgi:hypothetical protein